MYLQSRLHSFKKFTTNAKTESFRGVDVYFLLVPFCPSGGKCLSANYDRWLIDWLFFATNKKPYITQIPMKRDSFPLQSAIICC